jgi:uridine kinase
LAAGAEYLQRFVLGPIAARKTANWQLFDWSVGERGEWREFSGGTPLIVEGCGALNSQSAELVQFKVWIETPEDVRHERWLAREGNDEHWAAWAAQELDFYAREKSQALAETRLLG